MPPCKLTELFNAPAINSRAYVLSAQDLSCRFPNLYLPADLVRVDVEWGDVLHGLRSDVCKRIYQPVSVILETNVVTLVAPAAAAPVPAAAPAAAAAAAEEKTGEGKGEGSEATAAEAAVPAPAPTPAALELPRFTYVTPPAQDGYGVQHSAAPRPIKFNARVLVTLGMKELEADKIDHLFARRLRVLCGRRKKAATLLGGSWCAELDGGNPMEDRGCLLNTARRALLAQTLLDLAGGAGCRCNIVKLGEVSYHRPQEEYNGQSFPEQEECTALFLCVLQVRAPARVVCAACICSSGPGPLGPWLCIATAHPCLPLPPWITILCGSRRAWATRTCWTSSAAGTPSRRASTACTWVRPST